MTEPVNINDVLKMAKRDVAAIMVAYDPNTGQLHIESKGFLPVEEIGALQWALHMRMVALGAKTEPKPIKVGVTQ